MTPREIAMHRVTISTRMRRRMATISAGGELGPPDPLTPDERRAYYRETCPEPAVFKALQAEGLIVWRNGWELA